jgi:2'-5' RNA ligase
MQRLFISIDPDASTAEQLANLYHGIRGARWTPIDQLHLTIRFIGEVDDAEASDIKECLSMVHYTSFDLLIKGTGFFPLRRNPTVIWAGVEISENLKEFHSLIEQNLKSAGIAGDKRNFHPHITLARLNEDTAPAEIIPFLSGTGMLRAGPVHAKAFHLYSSILYNNGPVHTREESYELY